jgi:hypothetical protein
MKTIANFVREGIQNPSELQDALQTAMRFEFSTLPPYLCAQWSIRRDDPDPGHVARMIRGIALQEMYHFALAGNILSAIGGAFAVTDPSFLPTYPTNELPGHIHQESAVDLLPLSKDQLKVFMQIEKPEFDPVQVAAALAERAATIGQFYTELSAAIKRLNPAFNANASAVVRGEAFRIPSILEAQRAIDKIKGEGEGVPGMPDQPDDPNHPAHFYVFEQMFLENVLVFDPNSGKLVRAPNQPIPLPKALDFKPDTSTPSRSTKFNQILARLLKDLKACWTYGADIQTAVDDMGVLEDEGRSLIEQGIRPEFAMVPAYEAWASTAHWS